LSPAPYVLIKRDNVVVSAVVVWAAPPDFSRGTIEDLVCEAVGADICSEAEARLSQLASVMLQSRLSKKTERWIKKIAPLLIPALEMGGGTIVWSPGYDRCGIDLAPVLRRCLGRECMQMYKGVLDRCLRLIGFL